MGCWRYLCCAPPAAPVPPARPPAQPTTRRRLSGGTSRGGASTAGTLAARRRQETLRAACITWWVEGQAGGVHCLWGRWLASAGLLGSMVPRCNHARPPACPVPPQHAHKVVHLDMKSNNGAWQAEAEADL